MTRCLVHSRPDGGVSITHAAPATLAALVGAGGLLTSAGVPLETALGRMIAAGWDEAQSRTWLRALEFGGCGDAEAWDLIRWRSVPADHTAAEVWDFEDVPADRWFRNAWRRSANGGPIWVDLERARGVQRWRIGGALAAERARCERELLPEPVIDRAVLRAAIERAPDLDTLHGVWPSALARIH